MANYSRTYYVKKNIFFGAVNQVIGIVLPFVIRTVIVYRLGEDYLGLSGLFSSILQVFNMADMGFASAVTFRLYKPLAERDTDKVCALMGFYKRVYRLIGLGLLVVGLVLIPFVPYLIKDTPPDGINIYILYLMYLANTTISYLFFAYKNALLNASQRQDILSKIDGVITILRSLLQIVMLLAFSNYYLYVLCLPIFSLMLNGLTALVTNKVFPEYACSGDLPKSEISSIWTQVKGLMIGKVQGISRNAFDTIIVSAFLGLASAAIYSNYYHILSALISAVTIITNAMRGSVGNSVATESKEKNYQDFLRFNYYFAWLGAWCVICMLCLYQPFMLLWMGKTLVAPEGTMILFCIYDSIHCC